MERAVLRKPECFAIYKGKAYLTTEALERAMKEDEKK